MAKEKTTVGLSGSTIALVLLVIAVLGFAAFWKDRGGVEATVAASSNFLLASHETRITKTEKDIGKLDERADRTERTQLSLQKDQQAILSNQVDMKFQQNRMADLQIEQIKTSADLNAYLRSIEKIE